MPEKRSTSSTWMVGPTAGKSAVEGALCAAPEVAAQTRAPITTPMLIRFIRLLRLTEGLPACCRKHNTRFNI
jgi:hypothetical protein